MISFSKLFVIFTLGIGATILLTLMLYAGFSQFFMDNILNNIDANNLMIAAVIILSFVFITFFSSYVVSIFVSTGLDRGRVSFLSLGVFSSTFLFLLAICTFIVWYVRPDLIDSLELSDIDYLLKLPALCVFFFGVYILNTFIGLIILIIIIYFLFFIFVLWVAERF